MLLFLVCSGIYGSGLLIIGAAWLRIIYAGSPRNWFKR